MLAAIIMILLFLGCLMDQVAIMMLTVPLFYPVIQKLGLDPIWFSVIFMLTLEVALITPPFGMGLFVLQGVCPKVPFRQIVSAGIPYILCTFLLIILVMLFPPIATWLPSMLK
jgi:TRAP-type C4-dicarboxylate transport system permease large subunit